MKFKRLISKILIGVFIINIYFSNSLHMVNASYIKEYKKSYLTISKIKHTSDGIYLKYNKDKSSYGYKIFRQEDGGKWEEYDDTTGKKYVDEFVETGVQYKYSVRGYTYNNGKVVYTKIKESKPIIGLPAKVLSVKAVYNKSGNVKITWKKNSEASGYYIYKKKNNEEWTKLDVSVGRDVTKYSDIDIEPGNIYQYKVIAFEIVNGKEYVGYLDVDASTAYRNSVIDVSYHNGKINWKKVKKDGIDFAFIRAGYGLATKKKHGVLDTQFARNIKNAKKNGINIGIYLYSTSRSVTDSKNEAEFLIKLLKKYKVSKDCPIAYDFESLYRKGKKYKKQNTKMIKAFCKAIEKEGYDVLVYSDHEMLTKYVEYDKISKYGTWLAYWTYDHNRYPAKLENVQFWQYSDRGRIKGISEYVDKNVSFISY